MGTPITPTNPIELLSLTCESCNSPGWIPSESSPTMNSRHFRHSALPAFGQLSAISCDIVNAAGKHLAMAKASALVITGGARQLSQGLAPEAIIARATKAFALQWILYFLEWPVLD